MAEKERLDMFCYQCSQTVRERFAISFLSGDVIPLTRRWNILSVLREEYDLRTISNPEEDIQQILM